MTLDIRSGEVSDDVGYRLVGSGLVVPLADGLGEHARFGESPDELPHVCSIRDGVISNFGKVAALGCIDKDIFDRCCWVPWCVKSSQVGFEVFECDLAIHFLEVVEESANRD